jgi:hypothetical protein
VNDPSAIRRLKERRRPWDRLERKVVKMHLSRPDAVPDPVLDSLRYVISFARLTTVRTSDGTDVEVSGTLALHAQQVLDVLQPKVELANDLWEVVRVLPELTQRTRVARTSLLEHLPIDRESLEREVTTRNLVVISGGGGGAGYGYLGAYQLLDRHDLVPDLLVGTSIGALTSLFRARRLPFELAPVVSSSKDLSWGSVLRVLESESRYGLPATLRMYLRSALGDLFASPQGGSLTLADLPIRTMIMATGITVDALKHDLDFYEHLMDREVGRGPRDRIRAVTRAISVLREFLARRDALVELALGWSEGTREFDALDAAGFSAAVPGVLHYDVLRDDERMRKLLDDLYASYGITRLGEGGLVSNVPARTGWAASVTGELTVRQPFVLALDCFAPNPRRIAWMPLQQLVRSGNVERDRKYADLYLPLPRTLSPMNVVPAIKDALMATTWGREALEPHMPYVSLMMRPIQVLPDA